MRYLLIAMSFAAASMVLGQAWPTYHGGPDLQGFAETKLPERLERAWIFNSTGSIETTPVSDEERIYISPGKGRIAALSLEGSLLWEKSFSRTNDAGTETPYRFDAPLLCHRGLLLAGSSRGSLIALDAATGDERWRLETDGIFLGSPNVIDEQHVVMLDQGSGALHCVNIQTGKIKWTTDGVERCDGSPGVGNRQIVFGSCLAALHIYDAADGRHIRDIEVGGDGQIAGGVAVSGNKAYFGTRDGRLICADLDRGTLVWTSSESDDQTFSTPAIGSERIVYTSDDGWVYAVDRTIGRTVWKYDTGGMPGSPVIAGDKVLVTADGELTMLNLATGSLLWKKAVSDEISSPAIIHGSVVIGADDGTVSAWGEESDAPQNGMTNGKEESES